ncbi:unnamed protein product [Sphagnum jensenii]|uniref:Uncharacterized protein n=1 Tax=Sphagnum jensenii TaxID=128206 RepID=A0ABP1BZM1_9BRYO
MIVTRARAQDPTTASPHDPQVLGKYQGRTKSKLPRNWTSTPPPLTDPPRNRFRSQSTDSGQWSVTTGAQENRSTAEPPPLPSRAKGGIRVEVEKPPEEATTPKINLFFELPGLNCSQA